MLARTAAVTGGLATTGTVLAACGGGSGISESTRIAERLAPLALAASDDAIAARTLSARNPDRSAALAVIATERQTHATTINDEIARLAPDLARPSTASGVVATPVQPSGAAPTSAAPQPTVTTVEQLRERLTSAASSTGDLAVGMSGYRAGMLGSIAAACSAQVQVQLG